MCLQMQGQHPTDHQTDRIQHFTLQLKVMLALDISQKKQSLMLIPESL